MFSPAKIDLINDESDVTDFSQPTKVIELYPRSGDTSPDITSEKPITIASFCQQHSITSEQFLALRRKAARKYPDTDFKPVREGSRTFWVKNAEILSQMIESGAIESKPIEVIDAEIVETQTLCDGSSLVVRKQSFNLALPSLNAPQTREIIHIDISPIQHLTESLRADQSARAEMEELTELKAHAEKVEQKKAQFELVEMLIKQGYSVDQAVSIAKGVK